MAEEPGARGPEVSARSLRAHSAPRKPCAGGGSQQDSWRPAEQLEARGQVGALSITSRIDSAVLEGSGVGPNPQFPRVLEVKAGCYTGQTVRSHAQGAGVLSTRGPLGRPRGPPMREGQGLTRERVRSVLHGIH